MQKNRLWAAFFCQNLYAKKYKIEFPVLDFLFDINLFKLAINCLASFDNPLKLCMVELTFSVLMLFQLIVSDSDLLFNAPIYNIYLDRKNFILKVIIFKYDFFD